MKRILRLIPISFSILILFSCSQNETNPNDSGMNGSQFDFVISKSLNANDNTQWASMETYIVNPTNGKPLFHNGYPQYVIPEVYWIAPQVQRAGVADQAVIIPNYTMVVRFVTIPTQFSITLYKHIDISGNSDPQWVDAIPTYTVNHPKISYLINTTNLQPFDCIEFHIGQHAEVTSYKVHRGLSIDISNPQPLTDATVISTGNVTQL